MELETENQQLRYENAQLFCAALNEKDARIAELDESENKLKQRVILLDGQCRLVSLFFVWVSFVLLILIDL